MESVLKIIRTLAFVVGVILTAEANGAVIQDMTVPTEQKCLAQAIYYEARSEPLNGQVAVGYVVLNRSQSGRYPKTICGVVYQRGYKNRGCQFGWTCRRHAPAKGSQWQHSQQLATQILEGKFQDVSRGALNFHNRRVKKGYSTKNYQRATVIGNHIFWAPKTKYSLTNH